MAGVQDLGLAEFFTESTMKIQSSAIYKALRGDGMRVRPLAKTRSTIGKSQTSHAKSESRPGSSKPEKGRVAAIKQLFESKAVAVQNEFPQKTAKESKFPAKNQNQLAGSNQPPTKPGPLKREITPVSERSHQRMPFRSTKLERPVSRASLKEEESEKKPKTLRKTIDTKMLQKKSVPLFAVIPKRKGTNLVERITNNPEVTSTLEQKIALSNWSGTLAVRKAQYSQLLVNVLSSKGSLEPEPTSVHYSRATPHLRCTLVARVINKKKLIKRKRMGLVGRATVVAGKPVSVHKAPPLIPRKEEAKKIETGQKVLTVTAPKPRLKSDPKPPAVGEAPSLPKTPVSRKSRNSIVREVVTKSKITRPIQPARKQLWFPSETRESYNQFCPDTKAKRTTVRRRKPVRWQKRKTTKGGDAAHDDQEPRTRTAGTQARSKFENTTEDDSSDTNDEETRRMEELHKRNELKKKSLEFFNQFRYGEILRKSMPKIRYSSEVLARSEADVKRRMSDIEVRMRLNRLDESVSKINEFVPRWSGMLLATKNVTKMEKIQKTLTNAERILDGKVDKAKEMLEKYLQLIGADRHTPPTEEMVNIERHSELVQLDMDSLERIFESYEVQLQHELEEPTSVSM